MTREELAAVVENGRYTKATFSPATGSINLLTENGESVSIDRYHNAYYCVHIGISEKAYKEANRRALENAIATKKGELSDLEMQLEALEKSGK
jgi:hypothetical protein